MTARVARRLLPALSSIIALALLSGCMSSSEPVVAPEPEPRLSTMPDLVGNTLPTSNELPGIDVVVVFPSITVSGSIDAAQVAGRWIGPREASYRLPERIRSLRELAGSDLPVASQIPKPGEPVSAGATLTVTQMQHVEGDAAWLPFGHVLSVKASGAERCFECHTPEHCSGCHTNLD